MLDSEHEQLSSEDREGATTTGGRPLISCVAENTPTWFEKAFNLALSARTMGGSLSSATVVLNFVGGCNPRFRPPLEKLGAKVRVVEPWGSRFPFSNKLRMLELAREFDFDTLVMLDCDVIITNDISPWIDPAAIGLTPARVAHLSREQWEAVFRAMGIEPPAPSMVMWVTGKRTYPYYNSGVVLVPRSLCESLLREWSQCLRAFESLVQDSPAAHHENQVALALAILRGGFPVRELPPFLNLPTHRRLHSSITGQEEPRILHYHEDMDKKGFVLPSYDDRINRAIRTFNRHRAVATGQRFSEFRQLRRRLWLKLGRSRLGRSPSVYRVRRALYATRRMLRGRGLRFGVTGLP